MVTGLAMAPYGHDECPDKWHKRNEVAGDAVSRTPEPPQVSAGECSHSDVGYLTRSKDACSPAELILELQRRINFQWGGKNLPIDISKDVEGIIASVTAHKEAEIAQLRKKLAFEKQRQNEGHKVPALEAEVERLRKKLEAKSLVPATCYWLWA